MNFTYPVKELSFLLFFKLVFGHYLKIIVAVGLITLLPLFIDTSWIMFRFILQFHIVFFGGLFLSFVIHEYLHALSLRGSENEGEVKITFSSAKITIFPKFELTSKEMMKVAVLPLIILPIIGLLLIMLSKWINQPFIMFTGYLYVLHIVNILPPLGDGMMIIKAIVTKYEGG